MTPTEAAYFAGIVDGEGCIQIRTPPHRSVSVNVSNTSPELIDWLRGIGGTVRLNSHDRPNQKSQKPVFSWNVQSWRKCLDVLRQIAPHMIIKKEKAETAIGLIGVWLTQPHPSEKYPRVKDNSAIDPAWDHRRKAAARMRTKRYRERQKHLASRETNEGSDRPGPSDISRDA